MVAPALTPVETSWFLEGLDISGTQIAWGEDAVGFPVVQMPQTTVKNFANSGFFEINISNMVIPCDISKNKVIYTGIPGASSELTFGFRTKETIENGGKLVEITVPEKNTLMR